MVSPETTNWIYKYSLIEDISIVDGKFSVSGSGFSWPVQPTLNGSSSNPSEADEIYKICSVIGSPTESSWAEGLELASSINYMFPELGGVNLSALIPSASKDASLCSWDPCKRPTASEALQHPFFQSCYGVPTSLRPKSTATIARTPPSGLSGRRIVDPKCAKKYPGSLPNSKPAGNITSSAM